MNKKLQQLESKLQSISHNVSEEPSGPDGSMTATGNKQPPAIAPDDMPGYMTIGGLHKRKHKPTQHMKQALHAFRFLALVLVIPLQIVALHMLGTISQGAAEWYIIIAWVIPGVIWFMVAMLSDLLDINIARIPSHFVKALWKFTGPKHGN